MTLTLFAICFLTFMGLCFYILYKKVILPTWKWQEKCYEFKKRIKKEDDKDGQLKEFYELNKFSWHRTTGETMRELAIMLEMKYNIELLKN